MDCGGYGRANGESDTYFYACVSKLMRASPPRGNALRSHWADETRAALGFDVLDVSNVDGVRAYAPGGVQVVSPVDGRIEHGSSVALGISGGRIDDGCIDGGCIRAMRVGRY